MGGDAYPRPFAAPTTTSRCMEEVGIVGVAASGPGYLRGVDQRCGWSNRFVSAFRQVWELRSDRAIALGLKDRIVPGRRVRARPSI